LHSANIEVSKLLCWYSEHRRSLPWRETSDPYKIWLSEVMLQQTQVDTVIPYYNRWLKEFPTVSDVAAARLEKTLKLWEGLGYYARCRNFHKACKIVENEYNGKVPETWETLIKLPGVGDYTTAAVLSIAFDKPYPVLDGNVYRVLSRFIAFNGDSRGGNREFLSKLQQWIGKHNPGEFNQAFMELGSQLCRKSKPHCGRCPLSSCCRSFSAGNPEQYPITVDRPPRPHKIVVVGIVWNGERFLIQRRPPKGHLGGLWEFPGGKVEEKEAIPKALSREISEETGLNIKPGRVIGKVEHAYTHFSISLHAFHCSLNGYSAPSKVEDHCWITPRQIIDYPFPKANHKLFKLLDEQDWQQ